MSRIRSQGPMPFDTFMEMSLYDPDDGFFAAGAVRPGEHADFVTSPEVSPWFGRLIGRWVLEGRSEDPDGLGTATVVEIGGGSGSLLAPLVEEVGEALGQVVAIEVSDAARRSIADRVPIAQVAASLDDVQLSRNGVVVVNEVLDNLPARIVRRSTDSWEELCVGEVDGRLEFVTVTADAALAAWCDRWLGSVPVGTVLTAQMHMADWLREVLGRFETAAVLIIDYAALTSDLAVRRSEDVVRSFVRQQSGHDVFIDPGSTDVTVDVNIDVLTALADGMDLEMTVVTQREFLLDQGAADVLEKLGETSHERARAGDVLGQLVARSEATGLRALLDPAGLGGFTVFSISKRASALDWPTT